MKYFLIILVFLPFTLSAQFTKGDKFIGGTVGISTQQSPYVASTFTPRKANEFSLQPQLGFLLSKNLAFGGTLGYSHQFFSYGPDTLLATTTINQFSVGVFLKKYYSINDKFLFTLNGDIKYLSGNSKSTYGTDSNESKMYEISAGIAPAFLFFPSENWGIEAGIGQISFSHSKTKDTDLKTDVFNIDYGTFELGFFYYFHKINITID